MSIFKTFRAYQSLTPDQKMFIKEKRIEGWYAPDAWLAFFARVAEYDRFRDLSSPKVTGLGCGCFILMIVVFFIGILSPLWMILVAVFVIVFAVFFFRRRRDVPNHLRLFVLPLLAVLREEVKPDSTLFLRVDLRGGTLPEKLTGNQLSPSGLRLQKSGSKITEEFFADQWLAARALLADNTTLQLQAFDRIRKRQEGKKRVSGKYKSKTKHKVKTRLEATLRFSNRRYEVSKENLNKPIAGKDKVATSKVKVKEGASRTKINIRRVAVTDELSKPVDVREMLKAIATVYSQIAPKGATGGR